MPSLTAQSSISLGARAAIIISLICTFEAVVSARMALSGQVADQSGSPLQSVAVTLHKLSGDHFDESSLTDSRGRYSFADLPDGEYSLEAELRGFVSVRYKPLRIYFPADVERNFVLELAGFGHDGVYASSKLVGELFWRGARVSTASICLNRADQSQQPVCTVTNGLGQYVIDVPSAVYVVTVDRGAGLHTEETLDLSTAGEYRNKLLPAKAP